MASASVFGAPLLHTIDLEHKVPKRQRLIENIERKTKRTVSIVTTMDESYLAKCEAQTQSPLYQLPQELRDLIFEFACSQSPDDARKYDPNDYYYRPGHTARLITHTSLLLTCRRAWLETNGLPMQQAEQAFWLQRGPCDRHAEAGWSANVRNEKARYSRFLQSLTRSNLTNLTYIHLYMQMFEAERLKIPSAISAFLTASLQHPGVKPRRFEITIRSSDWWNWERGDPLALNTEWVQAVLDSRLLEGIDEFGLQLEAPDKQSDQLDNIVERLKILVGKPIYRDIEGNQRQYHRFTYRDSARTEWWSRSSRLGHQDHVAFAGTPVLHLRVTTLTWKRVPWLSAGEDSQPATIAATSRPEFTPLPNPVFHPPIRPRTRTSMIVRSRAQRDRLRQGGWMTGRFPDKADVMWADSVKHAEDTQAVVRERFEGMVGDIEAQRLEKLWEQQGSLLRFE